MELGGLDQVWNSTNSEKSTNYEAHTQMKNEYFLEYNFHRRINADLIIAR